MSLVALTVTPDTAADAQRLAAGARRMALEDPTLSVDLDERTGVAHVAAMSERHLAIVVELLRTQYDVEARVSRPHIVYKEIDGVLCEPVVHLVLEVPSEYTRDLAQNVAARHGRILSYQESDGIEVIVARVRLAELWGYHDDFHAVTMDRGASSLRFAGYFPCDSDDLNPLVLK